MSHIVANLHAYDCMNVVQATLTVHDYDHPVEAPEHVSTLTATFDGTGESTHREWMRDVLVALLEVL